MLNNNLEVFSPDGYDLCSSPGSSGICGPYVAYVLNGLCYLLELCGSLRERLLNCL